MLRKAPSQANYPQTKNRPPGAQKHVEVLGLRWPTPSSSPTVFGPKSQPVHLHVSLADNICCWNDIKPIYCQDLEVQGSMSIFSCYCPTLLSFSHHVLISSSTILPFYSSLSSCCLCTACRTAWHARICSHGFLAASEQFYL